MVGHGALPLCCLADSYPYLCSLLQLDAQRSQVTCQSESLISSAITTPLCWQEWDKSLENHPDQRLHSYIDDGIHYGFRIGYNYANSCRPSGSNLSSTKGQPQVVDEYLLAEYCERRVLGPLDPSGFPHVHTTCIGIIPKSTPGKWRLIVDMSFPAGASVNDGISEALCSLS